MKYYIKEINLNKINDNNIFNLKKNCSYILSKNLYLIAEMDYLNTLIIIYIN